MVSVTTTRYLSSPSLLTVRSASRRASLVHPLGMGDHARRAIDLVARNAVEAATRHPRPWTLNFPMNDISMRITLRRAA